MVLRVLGVLALVIGAIFASVMVLVLLTFLDNFNTSLLILVGVFGVLAYVFLAIGWQLFHPPKGKGTRADEPSAEGGDEAQLLAGGEGAVGLTASVSALAEVARESAGPVVAGAVSARALDTETSLAAIAERMPAAESEPVAESEVVWAEVESPGAEVDSPESEPAPAPLILPESVLHVEPVLELTDAPDPAPAPRPVPESAPAPEPEPAPSARAIVDPTDDAASAAASDDGDSADGATDDGASDDGASAGASNARPSDGIRPSGHRVPDRRVRTTFKKKGAALPRR